MAWITVVIYYRSLVNGGSAHSKQQESAKQASSGSVTPGAVSQPSPSLPQSAAAVSSATDVKSAGLADVKEEAKTPGIASLSSGNLTSTSSGFGFNVSLDKEENKVCLASRCVNGNHAWSIIITQFISFNVDKKIHYKRVK